MVSLSVNNVNTLADFEQGSQIKELYLRKNFISDLKEIHYLEKLQNLKVLWLSDNPCSHDKLYRLFIIKTLP